MSDTAAAAGASGSFQSCANAGRFPANRRLRDLVSDRAGGLVHLTDVEQTPKSAES
jgi:hypothetical protein